MPELSYDVVASTKDYRRAMEGAAESAGDVETSHAELEARAERASEALRDEAGAARRLETAQRDAAASTSDLRQGQQRAVTSTRDLAAATQRSAQSMDRMRGSAGGAQQILFSAGETVQDLQYGMQGAANNIAFMAEEFVQVSSRAGGAKAALSGVATSVLGPAGVIFALQALLAYGDDLVAFFQKGAEGADQLRKKVKSTAEEILEVQSSVKGLRATIGRQQAEALLPKLKEDKKRLKVLKEAIQERYVGEGVSGIAGLSPEEFQALQEEVEVLSESWSGVEKRVTRAGETVYRFTEEAAGRLRDAFKESGGTIEDLNLRLKGTTAQIENIEGQLAEVEALERNINQLRKKGVEFTRESAIAISDASKPVQEAKAQWEDLQSQLQEKVQIPGVEQADVAAEKVRFLQSAFEELQKTGVELGDVRLEGMRNALEAARAAAEDTGSALEGMEDTVAELVAKHRQLENKLRFLNSAEGRRAMRLERQNEKLKEQIEKQRELARLRAAAQNPDKIESAGTTRSAADIFEEERRKEQEARKKLQEKTSDQIRVPELLTGNVREGLNKIEQMVGVSTEGLEKKLTDPFKSSTMAVLEWVTTTKEGLRTTAFAAERAFGGIAQLAQANYQRMVANSKQAYMEMGYTQEEARKKAVEEHKKAFQTQKALQIAQATTSTFLAANRALAEGGPFLGPALAAGVVAAGLANVMKIANTEPGGGAPSGGGSGGGGISGGGGDRRKSGMQQGPQTKEPEPPPRRVPAPPSAYGPAPPPPQSSQQRGGTSRGDVSEAVRRGVADGVERMDLRARADVNAGELGVAIENERARKRDALGGTE